MALFPTINYPTLAQIQANPSLGAVFKGVEPNYADLLTSYPSEAQTNYDWMKGLMSQQMSRAQNEVYNAMNNGAAKDPNSPNSQNAKYYLDNVRQMLSGLPASVVSGTVPTFEQAISGNVTDPQGSQVVDSSGNVITPQTPAAQLGTNAAGTTNASGEATNSQGLTAEGMSSAAQGGGAVMVNGVDISHLSPTDQAAAQAVADHLAQMKASGQTINPNVPIDASTTDGYLQQAQAELGPQFQQLLTQSRQDAKNAMGDISSTLGSKTRDIGAAFAKNDENTQKNYASHGLEFSSDRTKAEQDVANTANNQMSDAETTAMQNARDAGIKAERELGTANLGDSTSGTLATGSRAVLGTPGKYTMSAPGSVRSLYTPTGGTTGSLEYAQNENVQNLSSQKQAANAGSNTNRNLTLAA